MEHTHPGPAAAWRYNDGCRHPECSAAAARATASYRRRRYLAHGPLIVAPHGLRRRIHALQAIGWPLRALDDAMGLRPSSVSKLVRRPRVHRESHEAVVALYDRLSMTPGPSVRARQIAAKNGWAPPLAWDDEELDRPDGRPADCKSTGSNRRVDVPRLLEAIRLGTTDTTMAVEFGVSVDAVYRALSRRDLWEAYDRLSLASGREARAHLRKATKRQGEVDTELGISA